MQVKHVFEDQIYVISSFGVARNPIYKDNTDVDVFKDYINSYLSEICHIYAYSHQENCFHYLVRIRERSQLESFFFAKQEAKMKNVSDNIYNINSIIPPDSYLIFSQEVSNCLNAYAKKFNHKYKRKGGLFGDRYNKHLVETSEEMEEWLVRLNNLLVEVEFTEDWKIPDKINLGNKEGLCSSKAFYGQGEEVVVKCMFSNFVHLRSIDLRGYFEDLSQKIKILTNFKNFPPNPPPISPNSPPI